MQEGKEESHLVRWYNAGMKSSRSSTDRQFFVYHVLKKKKKEKGNKKNKKINNKNNGVGCRCLNSFEIIIIKCVCCNVLERKCYNIHVIMLVCFSNQTLEVLKQLSLFTTC